MDVEFKNKKLRNCYERYQDAVRAWGVEVARRYVQRVNTLYACRSAEDLGRIPQARFHPLKGRRKRQHAICLTGMWRLIVSFPSSSDVVRIEEVSKHYDD